MGFSFYRVLAEGGAPELNNLGLAPDESSGFPRVQGGIGFIGGR